MLRTPSTPDQSRDTPRTPAKFATCVALKRGFAGYRRVLLGLLVTIVCLTSTSARGRYLSTSPSKENADASASVSPGDPPTSQDESSSVTALPSKGNMHPKASVSHDTLDTPQDNLSRALRDKQMKLLQSKFEKTKNDAAEMANLAEELRQKLSMPTADAHSPEVVSLADKIEKLAKRIRGENKGY